MLSGIFKEWQESGSLLSFDEYLMININYEPKKALETRLK